jgi:hypothetical protein
MVGVLDAFKGTFADGNAARAEKAAKNAEKAAEKVAEKAAANQAAKLNRASKLGGFIGKNGVLKAGGKVAGVTALVTTALVAAPFVLNKMRNKRKFKPENVPMMPMPEVMEAPMMSMGSNTMMGQAPVAGDFAQREMARRGGLAAGVDASSPNVMDVDGRGAPQQLGR